MAWDDAPPTDQELGGSSGGWDSTPPTEEELKPPPSRIESAIHGFVNNVWMGPQAAAGIDALLGKAGFQVPGLKENKPTYSENLEDYNQKFGEAKTAHPISYGAGAVTGALAPMAVPGVGAAMEAAPITSGAAIGAANAISNKDLTKDPLGTMKEAGEGAALGAGTSWGLGKILPKASTLESAAETKGLQSTGIGSKVLSEMTPEEFNASKKFVMENNLIDSNKEEVFQRAIQKQKELGETIKNVGKATEEAGIKANYDDFEKAVTKLDSEMKGVNDLEYKNIKDMLPRYQEALDDVTNTLSKDPTWNGIQQLKQKYGKVAFDQVTGVIKEQPAADTYFVLRDMLTDMTKRAQDLPSLPMEYKKALAGYHTIDPVIEGIQKAVGAERAGTGGHAVGHGPFMKFLRSIPGQSNPKVNLATATALFPFHPALSLMAAMPTVMNPAIQSKGFSTIAKSLPNIKQGLTQEMIDFINSQVRKKRQ